MITPSRHFSVQFLGEILIKWKNIFATSNVCCREKTCHRLKNTLVMLKTSDSVSAHPHAVLCSPFPAPSWQHSLIWGQRGQGIWADIWTQNWSRHDQREPELVLSDWERSQSSSFLRLYLPLTYCPTSQAVPGPPGLRFLCHQSRSDSGSLPCHEHRRFITSPLLPSLCLLPFDTTFLFLLRSSFIGLLQSHSHTFFYFSTLFLVEFQFLMFG